MTTSSTTSSIGDYLEQQFPRSAPSHAEDVRFHQIVADVEDPNLLQTECAQGESISSSQVAVSASAAEFKAQVEVPAPIRDTRWVVEPLNPELGESAIASLRALFEKNNVAEDEVKLQYVEELAVCPGISTWINRFVVVEHRNGLTEKYCAEYTLKNPEYTLCDMLKNMRTDRPIIVVV